MSSYFMLCAISQTLACGPKTTIFKVSYLLSFLLAAGTIEFLVQLLKEAQESDDRRAQGLSCTELANGLGRLAVNDANKVKVSRDSIS